ncbi:MAG: metallophosphoesterase family protein [Candidatus Aminicenantes bacterium]|nr:metallophosphoesterase family protein [Candidatus Aminicenantes bacterium]
MRYFIFTDIHGNLEALDVALEFAQKKKIDHYVCLGDLVGYGASPNEIVEKTRALKPLSIIRGNHDKAVSELDSIQTFNPIAAAAIHWTRANIQKKNMDYVASLKKGPVTINDHIMLCHGAPFDEDHYIFGEFDAAEAFAHINTPLCFFGHTHFPFAYTNKNHHANGTFLSGDKNEIKLEDGVKYLINPGSVGQPRDRDTRAAFCIYDSKAKEIKFYRLEYNIKETQRKILEAKLPSALAERLALGI